MKKLILLIMIVFASVLSGCEEKPLSCDEGYVAVEKECLKLWEDPLVCEDGFGVVGEECKELKSDVVCEEGYGLVGEECFLLEGIITVPEGMDPVFFEVMNQLLQNHYTQPDLELLWEGAVEGMINVLDDPYTTYFDLEEYQQYRTGFGETYVGIGVAVRFTSGAIVVEEVKSNSPALESGVQVNDIIVSVDGEMIIEENFYEVINRIIGDEGTLVTIGIVRQGMSEIIEITMERRVIDNPTVETELFEQDGKRVGYIKVNSFGEQTDELFANAVEYFESENVDGIIVDLRNNGGGQLGTVYNMLREFLVRGTERMFGTEYYDNGILRSNNYFGFGFIEKDYEIVTLVNGGSASASEVFASSMQEHSGYKVIGTQTFGKGTMQLTSPIFEAEVYEEDEATCIEEFGEETEVPCLIGTDRLHVTIGKWLTSEGNWVHGTGVTPDIIVERSEIQKAYKIFLKDEIIEYDVVDNRVKNIQSILSVMGYDVRTDGYFDTTTQNAILDIQQTNGLEETGNIDSDTMMYINDFLSSYLLDYENDVQLQASIAYFTDTE